jgi:Flp pilus assembly protein TadD/predicted Ser/Thr protein kinase
VSSGQRRQDNGQQGNPEPIGGLPDLPDPVGSAAARALASAQSSAATPVAPPLDTEALDLELEPPQTELEPSGAGGVTAADKSFREDMIGRTIGGCLIESPVSGGGMAHVFRAKHISLDKTVAMKVLSPLLARSRELRERFAREARIAGAIEHPNVIPVYGTGEADDTCYIIMRFLDGASLYRILSRQGMDQLMAAKIGEQIALALGAVHRAGFVHRDVKPENIVLTQRGEAFLTDFGVACETGTAERPGRGGSPPYMSPEQCRGEPLDGRSDLYSLGVTLFQMLTGRRPFLGVTGASLMLMHQQDVHPPVHSLRPDAQAGFAVLIDSLLAKHPAQRPQNAGALATALRDVQEDLRALRRKSSMLIQRRSPSPADSTLGKMVRDASGDEREADDKVEDVELGLMSLEPDDAAGGTSAVMSTLGGGEDLGTRAARRAQAAMSKERYDKALEHVSRALEFRPKDPRLYVTRGNIRRGMGDDAAAEADYRHALSLDGSHLKALTALGSLMRYDGRLAEAETHLRNAVELDPVNVEARIALGRMYEKAQAPGMARKQYEAAIQSTPHDERPYVALAALLVMQGKHGAAKGLLGSARERNPAYAPALYWLAVVSAAEGKPEPALDQLEAAVKAGYRGAKRVEEQSEFAAIRGHYRFQGLVTLLRG